MNEVLRPAQGNVLNFYFRSVRLLLDSEWQVRLRRRPPGTRRVTRPEVENSANKQNTRREYFPGKAGARGIGSQRTRRFVGQQRMHFTNVTKNGCFAARVSGPGSGAAPEARGGGPCACVLAPPQDRRERARIPPCDDQARRWQTPRGDPHRAAARSSPDSKDSGAGARFVAQQKIPWAGGEAEEPRGWSPGRQNRLDGACGRKM